jgi:hypothetical protein
MLFSKSILLEEADAYALTVGQTVTLVDIGNATVESIQKSEHSVRRVSFLLLLLLLFLHKKIKKIANLIKPRPPQQITGVTLKLDLGNTNYTNTLKLTWVAAAQGTVAPIDITMVEYDYLITKAGVPKVRADRQVAIVTHLFGVP